MVSSATCLRPVTCASLFLYLPQTRALPITSTGKLLCHTILDWPTRDKTGHNSQRSMLDDVMSQDVTRMAAGIQLQVDNRPHHVTRE